MATHIQPDIPVEHESFFGVVQRSTIQIALGACVSLLHRFLGIDLVAERLLGLLVPNVMLALAGIGERVVQSLQGVYTPPLLDHSEELFETPFDIVGFPETLSPAVETCTHAPSTVVPSLAITVPSPSPLPEKLEVIKSGGFPASTFEIVALASLLAVDDVEAHPPHDQLSERTNVMIGAQDDFIHELCVIICAVFVGFISASLLFWRSGESDTASSKRTVSLVKSTSDISQATRRRRTSPFDRGLPEDLPSNNVGDEDSLTRPSTSTDSRWTRLISRLVPTLTVPLGPIKSLLHCTIRQKIQSSPVNRCEGPSKTLEEGTTVAQLQTEELLGVGQQWDTLGGFFPTVPTSTTTDVNPDQDTIHEVSQNPAAPSSFLSHLKNAFQRSRISVLWRNTMFKSLFLLVPATGLTYLGGIAFFVPASIFFAVYRLIYAKINSKPEADIENQLDSLREVFEDDPDRKTLLGDNSSVPTVNVPHSTPLVIVEEEDDRSCQFGHEPVLEYAPLDNQGTAEKTPPVVQDAEAFAPDCHSPQKELPSRSESSPDRHAEENNNDSIVVGSTELPEMFQAMRSTESIANPQMDTVNSGENVADPQAVSEEDLVANLIVSAAQSSDSIVVLASPASPQRQSDNPENLGFVVETIQSHFLKKDAPLVGLSGQIEEEDANVDTNNDNASICSDVGSYVTAGDSDDEREETSPMTTDDEDLDSYHSSVEDTEEEVAKSEAVQVNQKSVVQPSTPLAGGTSLGEHLVDPAAQEASTPTQRQTVVEEKQEEGSDESLYESCPQKSVRYIDDSDVDVDEPEPIVAKTLTSSWSRIPRFSFGNNLFTSRSIHRFEVLNTLPPLSSLRRVPSVLETPSVRRSVSFAMSSDMVDPDLCSTEPPLTPKGRMMKLKDKQLKGKPRDMSGVKDRENANTKKKISKEGAKPRFSI